MGKALIDAGRGAEALEILHQAQALYRETPHNGSPILADIAVNIARANISLGRIDAAVAASAEGLAFWKSFDATNRHTGMAFLWDARALAAAGDSLKAKDALRQAAQILDVSGIPPERALLKQTRSELRDRKPQKQSGASGLRTDPQRSNPSA